MQKRKWRWVTRDEDLCHVHVVSVHGGKRKPEYIDNRYRFEETEADFNHDAFEAMTGIKIKPGDCLKVEFAGRVVE